MLLLFLKKGISVEIGLELISEGLKLNKKGERTLSLMILMSFSNVCSCYFLSFSMSKVFIVRWIFMVSFASLAILLACLLDAVSK